MSDYRDDERVDRAIDRAVHERLDVEPPPGFQAGVLRRIGQPKTSRSTSGDWHRKIVWGAIPAAAAVALLVALLLSPERIAHDPQPPTSATTATTTKPGPPRLPAVATPPTVTKPGTVPAVTPAPSAATARRQTAAPADRVMAANTVDAAEPMGNIEALESIAPIEVAPLTQHRFAAADVSVRPLTPIVELQIAPLNPPDRRN